MSRLLLLAWFAAAQSVVWTDCGEGLFCADKDDCTADDCCPGEKTLCAHLEPQGDVDRPVPAPDADVVLPVALVEPAPPATEAAPSFLPPDVPPRLRPRPLHLQISLLLI